MLDRLVATLRALASGVSRPTASCCSGDPIAWEKDWARRRVESARLRADRDAEPGAPPDTAPDAPGAAGR